MITMEEGWILTDIQRQPKSKVRRQVKARAQSRLQLLSMEEIAASLAHEVKNPLSLVKASIDLLERNDMEERNKQSYKIMRRELDKINELLLDFIQFAKPIGEGDGAVCLNDILQNVIEPFRAVYRDRIEFSFPQPEDKVVIFGDESKLVRVFSNMLKNAVEAIEALELKGREKEFGTGSYGKIEVNLSTNGNQVEIAFEDNGKGISGEEAEKIAQPFYSTKRGGSGLGLYVSKSIIAEHGGSLEITGKETGGCAVTIKLP